MWHTNLTKCEKRSFKVLLLTVGIVERCSFMVRALLLTSLSPGRYNIVMLMLI